MSTSADEPLFPSNEETALQPISEPAGVITLNVGGKRHLVLRQTLARQPDTRLGKLERATDPQEIMLLCDTYSNTNNEFFFDRQPQAFHAVLQLHRTGHLHLVDGLCPAAFKEDLDYWGVSDEILQPCCQAKYFCIKEEAEQEEQLVAEIQKINKQPGESEKRIPQCKRVMWNLLENPTSSVFAKIIAGMSLLVTFLLITIRILASLPVFSLVDEEGEVVQSPIFDLPENLCIGFIGCQCFLRYVSSPKKSAFITNLCFGTDMIILAFFATSWTLYQVAVFFRVLDVLRIVKGWSSSIGVKSVLNSALGKEILAIALFLSAEALILGSAAYYAEIDSEEPGFELIVDGIWWAAITLTTIGYSNDTHLKSLPGKAVAFFCHAGGLLTLALLMAAVRRRYEDVYRRGLERQKTERRLAAKGRAKTKEKHSDDNANDNELGHGTKKKQKKGWKGCKGKDPETDNV